VRSPRGASIASLSAPTPANLRYHGIEQPADPPYRLGSAPVRCWRISRLAEREMSSSETSKRFRKHSHHVTAAPIAAAVRAAVVFS
jgi:hypothetical protein